MQNNLEMIVLFDKEPMKQFLISGAFIVVFLFLLFFLSRLLQSVFFCYLIIMFQIILILAFAVLSIFLSSAFLRITSDKPAAIINQDGFWLKSFGLITWSNIEKVEICTIPYTPVEVVSIQIKSTKYLFRRANFEGKTDIVFSKLLGCPPVGLSDITTDNYQVIRFAQQFLNNNDSI